MSRAPTPGRGRAVTLLAAAMFMVALAIPGSVLGHAELDTIAPANGSTVTTAPTQIVATFTEALDPSKSSIVVLFGGGQIASGGQVDATDTKKMTLALPTSLQTGHYEVRWTSASAQDGDLDRGRTGFDYAPASAPSPTATPATSATPAASVATTSSPSTASVAPSPSGDTQPTSASTTDLLIPIVVAVILVAGLGYWLLRGRSTSGGTP